MAIALAGMSFVTTLSVLIIALSPMVTPGSTVTLAPSHNVAVVMGGFSDEYIVSLKSGQLIFDELDRDLYNVYRVHVLKKGCIIFINTYIV